MAGRSGSLDAMRGLAVLFMLEVHLGSWWARSLPPGEPLVEAGTILGGMAAPVFLVLAGAGLALSRAHEPEGFLRRSAVRGAALLAVGVVFTFIEQAVYGPFGWGVLQSIGLSMLLCAPLMRLERRWRELLGIVILASAMFAQGLLGVPEMLYSDQMMQAGSLAEYMRNMLVSGFFPLLPWTGFMVLGTAAGERAAASGNAPGRWGIAAVSLPLLLIFAGALLAGYGVEPQFFPPSLSFSFLASGIVLLAIPVFLAVDAGRARPLSGLGRISLTVFIAHHFLGYELFRALGWLRGFELGAALALVLASWALALLAGWAWARADFRWSLEWMLGRISRGAF